MKKSPSRAFVILFAASAVLSAGAALADDAASKPNPDISALDVAGVRLGMSPDEAVAALKKFNEKYVLEKQYRIGAFLYDPHTNQPVDVGNYALAEAQKRAKLFAASVFTGRTSENNDWVTVTFSLVPNHEQVISVVRGVNYSNNQPSYKSVKDAILGKYGDNLSYLAEQNRGVWGYLLEFGNIFDSQDRFINNQSAKSRHIFCNNTSNPVPCDPANYKVLEIDLTGNNKEAAGVVASSTHAKLLDMPALSERPKQAKDLEAQNAKLAEVNKPVDTKF